MCDELLCEHQGVTVLFAAFYSGVYRCCTDGAQLPLLLRISTLSCTILGQAALSIDQHEPLSVKVCLLIAFNWFHIIKSGRTDLDGRRGESF